MNGRRLESGAELLRRFRNVFGLTLSDVEHPFGLSRVTWERIERGEVVLKRGVPVVIREIRSLMEMIGETIPEDDVHKWAVRPLGRDDKSPRDLVVHVRWRKHREAASLRGIHGLVDPRDGSSSCWLAGSRAISPLPSRTELFRKSLLAGSPQLFASHISGTLSNG